MTIIEQQPITAPPAAPVVPQERLELADLLDGAADILVRDGWAPNGESYPRRCAVMAMSAFAGIEWAIFADFSLTGGAVSVLAQFLGVGPQGVPDWNDAQTSGQVVIDALRSCAIAARSGLL